MVNKSIMLSSRDEATKLICKLVQSARVVARIKDLKFKTNKKALGMDILNRRYSPVKI